MSCQSGGRQFVLDTSGDELRHAMDAGVYLVKPGMRELRNMSQQELAKEFRAGGDIEQTRRGRQAGVVVVSLGAAGVLPATENGCTRMQSPSVPTKSKVGAGDSTVAGIVLGLAAGAAAVMTEGTQYCTREDTEQLFERMKDGGK